MGRITKFSQIETFRRARHGKNSRLRFLTDDRQAAEGYEQLAEMTSNFYLSKGGVDAASGAYLAKLAINKPRELAAATLARAVFVDLILDEGTRVLRYRLSSESPPTTIEDRWYFKISGAFSDKTPIKQ